MLVIKLTQLQQIPKNAGVEEIELEQMRIHEC